MANVATKPICPLCGSDEVLADAFCKWDITTQTWVMHSTYQNGACQECGDALKRFDWIGV